MGCIFDLKDREELAVERERGWNWVGTKGLCLVGLESMPD